MRLAHLQSQLLEVDSLIAQLEQSSVSDPRPSVLANIRALQKEQRSLQVEFDNAAIHSEFAVYRYRILTPGRALIAGVGDTLKGFQALFGSIYNSLRNPPTQRGKTKKPTVETLEDTAPQFAYGYSFEGSIGVALTMPRLVESELFENGAIKEASQIIFDVARAHNVGGSVAALAKRFGPAVVSAMYKWTAVNVRYGFGVGVEWKHNETTIDSIIIQPKEMQALHDELATVKIESRLGITGSLVALDTDTHTFRMRDDAGVDYEGDYSDAITPDHTAKLPARYSAVIRKTTKAVVIDDQSNDPQYFLLTISDT